VIEWIPEKPSRLRQEITKKRLYLNDLFNNVKEKYKKMSKTAEKVKENTDPYAQPIALIIPTSTLLAAFLFRKSKIRMLIAGGLCFGISSFFVFPNTTISFANKAAHKTQHTFQRGYDYLKDAFKKETKN